jgi:hypothetical protein
MSNPSECQNCLNNTHNSLLPCAIHPYGPTGDCPDFEPEPHREAGEFWEPRGASYYGDELIITPVTRWTQAQRLELLMWHPIFTGLCPDCRHQFFKELLPQVHWDCPACTWRDDSL